MLKFLLITIFLIVLLVLGGGKKASKQTHLIGYTMGTYYSIKYLNDEGLPSAEEIQAEIDSRLETVNNQMSTFRRQSELSRFNHHKDNSPFTVSRDTIKVISEAIRINKLSEGALDITVGSLVNLWGFGTEGSSNSVPTDIQIANRCLMTGIGHLSIIGNNLIKSDPDLYVDLSSIAKGFGVDVVANYLSELDLKNYLVEIGGELRLKGVNMEGQPWRIAIEKPRNGQQSIQEIITPGDMSVATSGDYRNFFEENGIRYSHTIDPTTCKPINHHLISVTVLDKHCMTADGLSTAFMVMGPEKALALANSEKILAFFIVKTDNYYKSIASDEFKKYLIPD
ncbi:FAD:protein FMN transferase [Candidatus Enterovibrio escicola]|nr:FAD:protein FMN transferase [Candidatus Enterovibrio escacola]